MKAGPTYFPNSKTRYILDFRYYLNKVKFNFTVDVNETLELEICVTLCFCNAKFVPGDFRHLIVECSWMLDPNTKIDGSFCGCCMVRCGTYQVVSLVHPHLVTIFFVPIFGTSSPRNRSFFDRYLAHPR